MKIVAVGFKVGQENSVSYSKTELRDGEMTNQEVKETLGRILYSALRSHAEFVSIRFIPFPDSK